MIDLNKLAENLEWSDKKATYFYHSLFQMILEEMKNPEMKTIHLQNFGKFYVKKNRIDKVIQAYIKRIRNGEGDEEYNKERIRSLWKARQGKSYRRI